MELKQIGDAIEQMGRAFEEYKATNDKRLEAIKAGASTEAYDAKLAKMDEVLDEQRAAVEQLQKKMARPGVFGTEQRKDETPEAAEYREAFVSWVRNPRDHSREQRLREIQRRVEQRAMAGGEREQRAAQVITSTPSAGGFALPEFIERQIARLSVDISPIRQIATVRAVGTPDYKELFDINGAAFEWLGENATRNQTNTSDLAEVAPTFGMASAKPQSTEEALDDLFFDVEAWLQQTAAEAIAKGEGAAFISGDGTNKPTGFLAGPTPVTTADSSRAFGTLQYIASAQASAMPTNPDIFYDIVYSLRARYRENARWVTSKLVLAALRKYKEATTNAYMWQPGLAAGQPATFVGYPITEAEDMPGVTGGAFPLAFGDFREGYLICDRVGMRMTRDEITSPGFVKFYIRKRVGGKLRNTQAIKLLKIASS
jgi:HK97 family phage major capsid protein